MNDTATQKWSYKDHRTTIVAGVGAVAVIALVAVTAALGMDWNSEEGETALAVGVTIIGVTAIMIAAPVLTAKAKGGDLALALVCVITAGIALGMAAQTEGVKDSDQARAIHAQVAHGTTTNVKVDGDWVTSLRSADAQVELGRSEGIGSDNPVRVFADGTGTIHAQAGANVEQRRYDVEARTANGNTYQLVLEVGTNGVPTMIVVSEANRADELCECAGE